MYFVDEAKIAIIVIIKDLIVEIERRL